MSNISGLRSTQVARCTPARPKPCSPPAQKPHLYADRPARVGGRRGGGATRPCATAIKTLTPHFKQNPISTYLKLLEDSELQPLLSEPAVVARVAAVRSSRPGTVQLTPRVLSRLAADHGADADVPARGRPFVAYQPKLGVIAAIHAKQSWGSDSWMAELQFLRRATGKKVASQMLVRPQDCSPAGGRIFKRKSVAARVERVNRLFRDLGFRVSARNPNATGGPYGDNGKSNRAVSSIAR